VPEAVAAVRVVVTPVAIAFAVVPDKTVAAAVVAVTPVAMAFVVPPEKSVAVAFAVTQQSVAMGFAVVLEEALAPYTPR
jgi:hypothetical protein